MHRLSSSSAFPTSKFLAPSKATADAHFSDDGEDLDEDAPAGYQGKTVKEMIADLEKTSAHADFCASVPSQGDGK